MDSIKIFEQVKKRQQLLDEAIPQMLERSKTGQQDVETLRSIDKIMKSSKSPTQKRKQLESILKKLQP